ncbi:MAG: helix-turn-helix domain-containing protein [Myxococcales bacterium]
MSERIQTHMRARRLSVNLLADFSGLGRGSMSKILGGRGNPTLRSLKAIADALGVSVNDLLPAEG